VVEKSPVGPRLSVVELVEASRAMLATP
jgi:hypothetical protein